MLQHPHFDPVAFTLGPLAVHWYGLMYIVGFAAAWYLGRWKIQRGLSSIRLTDFEDLLFICMLGAVFGGRLGYVFFYKPDQFLSDPLTIFYLWEGGMSFHGGLIGVLLAIALYGYARKYPFFVLSDFLAPLVPLGLAAGRLGNFINGELWGRTTNVPWGMVFAGPQDGLARHPSQLYQFGLEGIALFIFLWIYALKPRPTGRISAYFLMGYGVARFIAEWFREPDDFLGLLTANLSMGQWLSLPMILAGVILYRFSATQSRHAQ